MGLILLDATVVVAVLDARDPSHGAAVEALSAARLERRGRLAVSVLAYAELALLPVRRDDAALPRLRGFLERIEAEVLPLTAEVVRAAATLQTRHRDLPSGDALLLATADAAEADELWCSEARWPQSVEPRVRLVEFRSRHRAAPPRQEGAEAEPASLRDRLVREEATALAAAGHGLLAAERSAAFATDVCAAIAAVQDEVAGFAGGRHRVEVQAGAARPSAVVADHRLELLPRDDGTVAVRLVRRRADGQASRPVANANIPRRIDTAELSAATWQPEAERLAAAFLAAALERPALVR